LDVVPSQHKSCDLKEVEDVLVSMDDNVLKAVVKGGRLVDLILKLFQ
jgi:hypothetical protein